MRAKREMWTDNIFLTFLSSLDHQRLSRQFSYSDLIQLRGWLESKAVCLHYNDR